MAPKENLIGNMALVSEETSKDFSELNDSSEPISPVLGRRLSVNLAVVLKENQNFRVDCTLKIKTLKLQESLFEDSEISKHNGLKLSRGKKGSVSFKFNGREFETAAVELDRKI